MRLRMPRRFPVIFFFSEACRGGVLAGREFSIQRKPTRSTNHKPIIQARKKVDVLQRLPTNIANMLNDKTSSDRPLSKRETAVSIRSQLLETLW